MSKLVQRNSRLAGGFGVLTGNTLHLLLLFLLLLITTFFSSIATNHFETAIVELRPLYMTQRRSYCRRTIFYGLRTRRHATTAILPPMELCLDLLLLMVGGAAGTEQTRFISAF